MFEFRDSSCLLGRIGFTDCTKVSEDITFQETAFRAAGRDFVRIAGWDVVFVEELGNGGVERVRLFRGLAGGLR